VAFRQETPQEKIARFSPYARFGWAQELFAEEHLTKPVFVPWVMWRHQQFNGKYITITAEGLRKTWNPAVPPGQKAKKVFCFGGSTTWGVGARDDFTIPSLLSKKLNQGRERFLVVNYGERGYTLMQEVINLVVLLKQGNVPDYVIFYDGVNEVLVGSKNNQAGSFYGADTVEFKLFKMAEEGFWTKIGRTLQEAKIYLALKDLRAWVRRQLKRARGHSPEEEKALEKLADDIVGDYLKNMEFVRDLARGFGFKYLFVWQPALITNKALTAEEKQEPSWNNMDLVKTYQLVYARMAKVQQSHFYNIADMFDQKTDTLFFSWAHITEEGNAQVVDRLHQMLKKDYPDDFQDSPVQGKAG